MKISLMLTYPEIAQGLFNFLKTPKCVHFLNLATLLNGP